MTIHVIFVSYHTLSLKKRNLIIWYVNWNGVQRMCSLSISLQSHHLVFWWSFNDRPCPKCEYDLQICRGESKAQKTIRKTIVETWFLLFLSRETEAKPLFAGLPNLLHPPMPITWAQSSEFQASAGNRWKLVGWKICWGWNWMKF